MDARARGPFRSGIARGAEKREFRVANPAARLHNKSTWTDRPNGRPQDSMTPSQSPSLDALDDLTLVGQARQHDQQAFTELVNRYASKIFRLARHITRNDQDAEDVLQETFLKAYSRLDQFQGNSSFYTWLVRIGVNESLMKIRRRKDGKMVSLDQELETESGTIARELADDGEDPEESYGRGELRDVLAAAIDSLSETYRTVFVLRDIEGLSTEETAEMLGLSISAVKSRLLRARLQLRDKLRRRLRNNGQEKNHM
jgi:RNA polymerase sigma-70 factor (ECF subfamily)